jgi:protein-disulfide isomerase
VTVSPELDQIYIATGQVQHIFRHFPLDPQGNAMRASKATYCSGQQDPNYFWALHDWIFENQDAWSGTQDAAPQFRTQALAVGVDAATFDACVAEAATESRIQEDIQAGRARGVTGTPAFFINDWFLAGAYPLAEFQNTIEKAKTGQRPPPSPTPLPQGVEFFDPDPDRPGFTYNGSPYQGDPEAPVVVLSFEDFANADAATHFADVEPTLKTKYIDTNQVRFVTVLFPLEGPQSAAAALCAARQNKFWEFRAQLYQNQGEWTEGDAAKMSEYAKSLGLDEQAFAGCVQTEEVQNQVVYSLDFAQKDVGVPVSPSYLVLKLGPDGQVENGQGYPGPLPLEQFEEAIQTIQVPPTPAPTSPPPVSREDLENLPMGVDPEGNFYRGDPKATVKLVDFSDFQ